MGRFIMEQILKVFWMLSIKKNRVVFRSAQGTKYNCNPKYICEYLLDYCPDKFEIGWVFDNPKEYEFLKQRGIKVFSQKSISGLIYIITSKFLIDNHGVQSYIPIRKKQVVINTWHGGGAYKKSYDNHSKRHIRYVEKMNKETTKFLSSCQKFSDCNLRKIKESFPEKIMKTGMPRNDLFFNNISCLTDKVKKKLGISTDKKIILYAPTFRDDFADENYEIDVEKVIKACEKRFGGKFIFAMRFHRFSKAQSIFEDNSVVDANGYDDMQELIYASDVVITDYSSLIWDVSLVYKPCFIYAKDLPKYLVDRNFYTPISEWPFPLSENLEMLLLNIELFDEKVYRENVDRHHKDLGSFEKGTACKQVAEYMMSLL